MGVRRKFSRGWQRFAYGFQVAGEAMQTDVHKTLYPFQTTKKMRRVRTIIRKMRFLALHKNALPCASQKCANENRTL